MNTTPSAPMIPRRGDAEVRLIRPDETEAVSMLVEAAYAGDFELSDGYRAEIAAVGAETRPGAAHQVGVALVGAQPREPRDDRVGRTVTEPGRTERAVERARDARDAVEESVGGESLGERTSRPHRADGVRTRGADPDREEIEG